MKVTIHDHGPDGTRSRSSDGRKSGTVVVESYSELNLGRQGYGEVGCKVAVSYSFSLDMRGVHYVDWNDDDDKRVPKSQAPTAAIEAAMRREVERKAADIIDEATGKI